MALGFDYHRDRRSSGSRWFGFTVIIAALLVLIGVAILAHKSRQRWGESEPEIATVYFTPGDQTTAAVVKELNGATKSVHMQAYSFTSAPIAKALVAAKKRGVDVIAILDKSNKTAQYSSADFLAHEGVSTLIDAKHAIAHNKIMIIDGKTVITGSFNFTTAAQEKNGTSD